MPRERRMIARSSFASKKLLKCTDSQFMLFVGLIVEADDEGRGEGETEALKMKFPNRKWSEKQIEDMMHHLSINKLVEWYTNDGGLYYEVINFLDFQQGSWHGRSAKPSQIPSPYVSTPVVHRERCTRPPEAVTPSTVSGSKGSEVKGSEVKGSEVKCLVSYTQAFLKAKAEYPKRKGNQNYPGAFKSWERLMGEDDITEEALTRACRNYRLEQESIDKAGTEFVMMMSTFFGKDHQYVTYMAEDFALEVVTRDPEETREYVRQFREGERNGTLMMDKERKQVIVVATGERWLGPGRDNSQ